MDIARDMHDMINKERFTPMGIYRAARPEIFLSAGTAAPGKTGVRQVLI